MTVPPQGGAKAAGIARRFCCAGFPAGNGRQPLSLKERDCLPIFFAFGHPELAVLRAAPRGITRRLRAAKTRPRTKPAGRAAQDLPQSKRKRMPKQPSRKHLRAGGPQRRQGASAFAPSAAWPPVGASVRQTAGQGAEQSPRRKFSAAGGQCHKKYSVVRNYPKTVLFTNP